MREATIWPRSLSLGTGIKSETRADFADFAEKAETGALGRALAGIGFGTQSSPDVEEGHRLVDAPVERRQPQGEQRTQPSKAAAARPAQATSDAGAPRWPAPTQATLEKNEDEAPANEQQLQRIRKLCAALGREEPAAGVLTFSGAAALIRTLSREFNDRRRAG